MKLQTKPWKHIIIDDFLEETHFNKLSVIAKDIAIEEDVCYAIVRCYLDSNGILLDFEQGW